MSNVPVITLREHLDVHWTHELVAYPVTFAEGVLHDEAVALRGPDGIIPAQLTDVACWPGTSFVQSATLHFIVEDLPPLAEKTYHPVNAATPATDLRIVQEAASVDIGTAHFGMRCPLGECEFPVPVPAGEVPGPVLGMRLTDGTWFGGSRLYGERKITRSSAKLTAAGPVFAEVAFEYAYDDGLIMRLTAQVAAGDSHAHWTMAVDGDALEDGWQLDLTPGLASFVLDQVPWEFFKNTWGAEQFQPIDVPLGNYPPGLLTNLVPWEDWWDDQTQTRWVVKTAGHGKTLEIASENPACWVEPAPKGTLATWDGWQRKMIGLCREEDGSVYLRINAASGRRAWRLGAYLELPGEPIPEFSQTQRTHGGGARSAIGRLLDVIKNFVLDWPGEAGTHPRMYLSAEELREVQQRPVDARLLAELIERTREDSHGMPHVADADALGAYLLTGDPEVAAETRAVERLRNHLGLFGAFDTMRFTPHVVSLYDALVDGPLVPEEERAVLRARLAYLGYVQSSPARWSNERGYRSYNLNMSVAHTLYLGMIACTIPTHPLAQAWVQPAIDLLDDLLNDVGPAGEWAESVSNYVHVSATPMLQFAITARSAGFRDFVDDPRMKRLLNYYARQHAPTGIHRAPGEPILRVLPPHGRAQAGHSTGLTGMAARATRESDPAYSAAQQWVWRHVGENREICNAALGGFEQVYLDANLPEAQPAWETDLFPQAGVIFRQGLGMPREYYVNLISADFPHQVFSSETGAFSLICAKGAPLAGAFFGGYAEREELLASRVCLARAVGTDEERRARVGYTGTETTESEESTGRRVEKPPACFGEQAGIGNVGSFSSLPRQDYAAVDAALVHPQKSSWKPVQGLPEWPACGEGQPPVHWRRQVLFLKDDGTMEASYLLIRDTVRGGQPTMWQMWTLSESLDVPGVERTPAGRQILPARRLEGDRFTARGQFGVDVDYYIASPRDTPRHTLRWGATYHPERCAWHPVSVLRHNYSEFRDLLHLQLPGDGAYFVAFYPRLPEEAVPSFTTLGEGKIIKVSGNFGTDYGFLCALPDTAAAAGISFSGTAASVQDRPGGLVLSLGAPGEIRHPGGYALSAEGPAQLHVADQLTITVPAGDASRQVTIRTPDQQDAVTLTVPAGTQTALVK
ncbi:MAG: hypothetical protein ACYC7E_07940 [Armatimonadota bacterium]